MSTSRLLDSSVLVLFLQQDTVIHQHLRQVSTLYVSTVALGELYYGAQNSGAANLRKSLNDVDGLAEIMIILNVDSATAKIFGQIKQQQRKKGRMIPDNDLWIAATALQYQLTLAARDKHFSWIDKLICEQW